MKTPSEIEKMISNIGGVKFMHVSKELKALPDLIQDDENIIGIISGTFEDNKAWLITLTDKRMFFLYKGIFSKLIFIELPLSDISAVESKVSKLNIATLNITIKDERVMVIKNIFKQSITPFVDTLNDIRPRYVTSDENTNNDNYGSESSDSALDEFENELTTVWAGSTKDITFTYESYRGEKSRRTVKPTEVSFNADGEFYIRGICLTRNAERTFKQHNITTKVTVASKLYNFDDWCNEVLRVDIFKVCPTVSLI